VSPEAELDGALVTDSGRSNVFSCARKSHTSFKVPDG